jgi:predicted ATPase/uncharacterized protein HemY
METGSDLSRFREQLKRLLRASGYTQKDLAEVLGLHHQVLSRKLVGNASAFLTHPEIKNIILTLVGWQSLTSLNETLALLALAGLQPQAFSPQEWQQPPLSQLKTDQPLNPASTSTATEAGSHPLAQAQALPTEAPSPVRFNNLPAPVTKLIGREWAITRASQMLREPGVRLLTLLGPGGSGKTRLALALARHLEAEFEQGVCFVGLASLTNPQLVIQTIARSLGLTESQSAGSDLLEQLGQYLKEMELLLVLDNFEQILPAASQLGELLACAPRLKIVATSREALRLYGEHQFGVPPLDLPDLNELPTGEPLYQYETVRLFTERAKAVKPDFTLTPDNEKVVAQICHLLEGLPLAIELAVAWLRLLSPQALLERLRQSKRLDLLVGGSANLPARHQTLRNTLEWGYQLLSLHQQHLFARLAIFRNGFTVEAVHQICFALELEKDLGQPGITSPRSDETLAQLLDLFDKNLIKQAWVEPEVAGGEANPVRFILLETVREYAVEQLQKSREEAELAKRHAAYYAELSEIAAANLMEAVPRLEVRQLELELDNLRAALNWSYSSKDLELHYRLLANLWRFWRFWGLISEGRSYLEKGLTGLNSSKLLTQPYPWLSSYLEALYGAGILAIRQSDYPKAGRHLEQGLSLAKQSEDDRATAKFLCGLGELSRRQASFGTAATYYEESLELYQKIGDKWGIGVVYHNLGALAHLQNNLALAHYNCEQALSIWEEQNNKLGLTGTYNILAEVALAEGRYQQARHYSERSLAIKAELGDKTGKGRLYLILGYVCLAEGNYEEAGKLLWSSLELLKMVNDKADLARCLSGLGFLVLEQDDYAQARLFFLESLAFSQKESRPGNLIGLSRVLKEEGEAVKAIQLCGTIQQLLETEQSNLTQFYRSEYEQTLKSLRSASPLAAFESAWEEGYNFKGDLNHIQEAYF